jgi:hypothetical protein
MAKNVGRCCGFNSIFGELFTLRVFLVGCLHWGEWIFLKSKSIETVTLHYWTRCTLKQRCINGVRWCGWEMCKLGKSIRYYHIVIKHRRTVKSPKINLQLNIKNNYNFHSNFNPLAPSNPYMGHTAQLTSRRCILNIYSTNIRTEYFKCAA